MSADSFWRTWKPYAVIVACLIGGYWWYSTQSSFAPLKDGAYDCQAVFVNEPGKYEVLVDEQGSRYSGISATVSGGAVVEMSGDPALPADDLASLTVRKRGTSHFHVTDDPATHSYNAVACERTGG